VKKVLDKRSKSQPIGEKSAGCIFKNPAGEHAGALIEKLGLKGHCVGDAQVSEKHANFIINKGKASAKDILQLIELIKQRVWEAKGIRLEEEVIIVGEG
jgi:UDP-N-acetylmuramate dehydrogenase